MKKTHFALVIVLTLLALVTSCIPAQTSTNNASIRRLNVTGTGRVELEPNIARVNIGVRTQSPNVGDALEENNAIAEAIIQNLKNLGIEENDIQTRNFNVSPDRSSRPETEGEEIQSFVVENTVSVVVRDFDSLGEVLASSIAEGANTIHGVSFDLEDRDSAVEEARQLAIEDAKAQAEAIAEAAGVDLGAIHSISFGRSGAPEPRAEAQMDMAVGGAVPISGGTLNIQMNVNIAYEIE